MHRIHVFGQGFDDNDNDDDGDVQCIKMIKANFSMDKMYNTIIHLYSSSMNMI